MSDKKISGRSGLEDIDEPSMDRSTDDEISLRSRHLYDNVFHHHPVKEILDSLFDIVMILDVNSQAVFVNRAMLNYLKLTGPDPILGRRPGEIFECVHSAESDCGCGTTQFCALCEARRGMMAGFRGRTSVEECHITKSDGGALDLGVSSAPLYIDNEAYSLLVIKDISDEKRVQSLEQVFFHDVLNISSVIWGLSSFLTETKTDKSEEIGAKIHLATSRLIGEIEAQRNLIRAENNQLIAYLEPVESLGVVRELVSLYTDFAAYHKKTIDIDPSSENIRFESDPLLLRRMIENMLKNALEVSDEKTAVNIGCRSRNGSVEFWVHNSGCIPEDVRPNVFKRGFSTKTKGRGIGTYSMKLISEKYLQGKVSFKSTMEDGTTFYARYPVNPVKTDRNDQKKK